ncbi:hypothetical protein HELRODRAFT_188796 [Helobdella robusta]|uniref:Ig-like domain-containing protein n=1 Tax=Helobdella robusta TaxID=6412 RepID=T1FQD3_HELRO|nr:hypothetical protein HELRODRAFT_188796 [Helobdella robusta]ESO02654.1 hypothetical protein HELRODRAFT_188796 [Helobdella robusta]
MYCFRVIVIFLYLVLPKAVAQIEMDKSQATVGKKGEIMTLPSGSSSYTYWYRHKVDTSERFDPNGIKAETKNSGFYTRRYMLTSYEYHLVAVVEQDFQITIEPEEAFDGEEIIIRCNFIIGVGNPPTKQDITILQGTQALESYKPQHDGANRASIYKIEKRINVVKNQSNDFTCKWEFAGEDSETQHIQIKWFVRKSISIYAGKRPSTSKQRKPTSRKITQTTKPPPIVTKQSNRGLKRKICVGIFIAFAILCLIFGLVYFVANRKDGLFKRFPESKTQKLRIENYRTTILIHIRVELTIIIRTLPHLTKARPRTTAVEEWRGGGGEGWEHQPLELGRLPQGWGTGQGMKNIDKNNNNNINNCRNYNNSNDINNELEKLGRVVGTKWSVTPYKGVVLTKEQHSWFYEGCDGFFIVRRLGLKQVFIQFTAITKEDLKIRIEPASLHHGDLINVSCSVSIYLDGRYYMGAVQLGIMNGGKCIGGQEWGTNTDVNLYTLRANQVYYANISNPTYTCAFFAEGKQLSYLGNKLYDIKVVGTEEINASVYETAESIPPTTPTTTTVPISTAGKTTKKIEAVTKGAKMLVLLVAVCIIGGGLVFMYTRADKKQTPEGSDRRRNCNHSKSTSELLSAAAEHI